MEPHYGRGHVGPVEDPKPMLHISAFHGSFANPRILRRDMGATWVDYYHDGNDWQEAWMDLDVLPHDAKKVVVGFSLGCATIGELSLECPDGIFAAVLYEPCHLIPDDPGGDFPVLIITNDRGRRRWPETKQTVRQWSKKHEVWYWKEQGRGRHWEFTWGMPPIRHGWDQSLNDDICKWILERAHESQTDTRSTDTT